MQETYITLLSWFNEAAYVSGYKVKSLYSGLISMFTSEDLIVVMEIIERKNKVIFEVFDRVRYENKDFEEITIIEFEFDFGINHADIKTIFNNL